MVSNKGNEEARLSALHSLNLLDTPSSDSFDRITRVASQIFGLPIAAISLTDKDRQWFKSRVGVEPRELPRYKAPCSQVATSGKVVIIPDLLADQTYNDSLLAGMGVRFYAGAPLITREGYGLGSMCVLGPEPRDVTEEEKAVLQDLAQMVMAQIELQYDFGRVDPGTGLPNRNQFIEDLQDLASDHRGEQCFAVVVDLADPLQLKQALRVIGPNYIDELVTGAAQAIREAVGSGTKLYLTGMTQCAFLLDASDDARAVTIEALRNCIGTVIPTTGMPVTLDAAIGVAPFHLGEIKPQDVLRRAHSAAQDTRDSQQEIGIYSAARDEVHRRRFMLLTDIQDALTSTDQLFLVYQPRIDLKTRACVGAEALLRWTHPRLGNVPPGEFIPLVEQTALARNLTDWVVGSTLRQIVDWHRKGIDIPISLNVSACNLKEEDFADRLIENLRRQHVSPTCIELELTESAVIENGQDAIAQLNVLGAQGVRIAIDDFGTGFSNLSYLLHIPASVVKIDRSLVRTTVADKRTRSLPRALISILHDLGYRVVAEGVETAEVFDALCRKSCDEAQGYLISHPLPPAAFEDWLTGNRKKSAA